MDYDLFQLFSFDSNLIMKLLLSLKILNGLIMKFRDFLLIEVSIFTNI